MVPRFFHLSTADLDLYSLEIRGGPKALKGLGPTAEGRQDPEAPARLRGRISHEPPWEVSMAAAFLPLRQSFLTCVLGDTCRSPCVLGCVCIFLRRAFHGG